MESGDEEEHLLFNLMQSLIWRPFLLILTAMEQSQSKHQC